MLAGTSVAMLVGTFAPETYSKFGQYLRRLHESGILAGTSAAMLIGTSAPETYFLSLVCIYVDWHKSGMIASTSAAMLVGTR